ncbi:hypothetical protein LguiA_018701 [Lonicera macranthoides]
MRMEASFNDEASINGRKVGDVIGKSSKRYEIVGYSTSIILAAEILGTFILVYTMSSTTDPKRSARDSHVPILTPLPIGFVVFMVHLATIPITGTGTGIYPAHSLGATVIYNQDKAKDDQWLFWVGPFIGAAIEAFYHQFILRAGAAKALGSFRSNSRD